MRKLVVRAWVWERPKGHAGEGWKMPRIEVKKKLRELCKEYDVWKINGDPALLNETLEVLDDEGLPVFEFPQTAERMVPPTQSLYQLVVNEQLEHDGDPVLARHLGSASAKETDRGWRLVKASRTSFIDAAVALVMAVAAANERKPSEGLRVLGMEEELEDETDWKDEDDEDPREQVTIKDDDDDRDW